MTADSVDPRYYRKRQREKLLKALSEHKPIKISGDCDICSQWCEFFIGEIPKVCGNCWLKFKEAHRETGVSYNKWRKKSWIEILLNW